MWASDDADLDGSRAARCLAGSSRESTGLRHSRCMLRTTSGSLHTLNACESASTRGSRGPSKSHRPPWRGLSSGPGSSRQGLASAPMRWVAPKPRGIESSGAQNPPAHFHPFFSPKPPLPSPSIPFPSLPSSPFLGQPAQGCGHHRCRPSLVWKAIAGRSVVDVNGRWPPKGLDRASGCTATTSMTTSRLGTVHRARGARTGAHV